MRQQQPQGSAGDPPIPQRRPQQIRHSQPRPLWPLLVYSALALSLASNFLWLGRSVVPRLRKNQRWPGHETHPSGSRGLAQTERTNGETGTHAEAMSPPRLIPKADLIDQSCAGGPWITQLRQHLENVVLIVNMNYDFVAFNTSSFLRDLYGRFFYDIVFIGPNEIASIPVEARGHAYWRHQWCFAYFYLPKITARYPKAEGFLWTNDDVVINYWQLIHGNKSKLWLPDTPECTLCQGWGRLNMSHRPQMPDGWSDQPWRKRGAVLAYLGLEGRFREQYDLSISPKRMVYPKRVVDVFFIPRRHVEALMFDLIPLFREFGVCSELGIPMMFFALDHPDEFDPVLRKMDYQWDRGESYDPRRFWNVDLAAYHHWKLAKKQNRVMLLDSLSKKDPCVLRMKAEESAYELV